MWKIFAAIQKNKSFIGIISIIISVSLCILYFSQFEGDDVYQTFFSSDSLYLPSIYKDLFLDGGAIRGWQFNYAPNFFPDGIFYFLLMFLTNSNFIISSFLFAVIQFYFILFIVFKIFKSFDSSITLNHFSLSILLFSLMPLVYIIDNDYYLSYMAFTNSYHLGPFVMSLVSLYLVLKYYKKPSWFILILLFIISAICIPCDKIYLICFIAPILICLCIMLILNYKRKYSLFLLCTLVVSTIVGLIIFDKFTRNSYFYLGYAQRYMSFKYLETSWGIFKNQMIIYISEFSIKQFIVILSIISYLSLLLYTIITTISLFKKKVSVDLKYFYILFSTIAIPIIIIAPILGGNYAGVDCIRYNIFGFFLALFNLILVLYNQKYFSRISNIVIGSLMIMICILVIIEPKKQNVFRA